MYTYKHFYLCILIPEEASTGVGGPACVYTHTDDPESDTGHPDPRPVPTDDRRRLPPRLNSTLLFPTRHPTPETLRVRRETPLRPRRGITREPRSCYSVRGSSNKTLSERILYLDEVLNNFYLKPN